ncbi:exosortase E/protease, VPEID-CTERM system [Acidicapsa ligni]|uniref:exosortase E/protease, VPEID-CTERM system n=1 Tax=Acidicapsa ligni TaxID=542300 RepID=UPI0021DF9126|nr:exosortase E/protease, VPEID-CTERM system [Acidicapsa ligni]
MVASIPHHQALVGPAAPVGIVAFAVFIGLGYSRLKTDRESLPFGWLPFIVHALLMVGVFIGSIAVAHGSHLIVELRIAIVAAIALLAVACVPISAWIRTLRTTHFLWLYSLLAGATALYLRSPFQSIWNGSSSAPGRILQGITFDSVRLVLQAVLPGVTVDPASFTIGTPNFVVIVAEACSGLEGLALVLVFTTLWLWYFRKESRFPQALVLIPCALISVWILNVVRISALVLIGNAFSSEIAMVGFHSQAGWIAFTAVALAFSMAMRKLSWVRKDPVTSSAHGGAVVSTLSLEESGESPATAAYLVPFLAILAATFISRAASGHFEWLYPLRFVAAAFSIWHYRAEYKNLNWRFSWTAPLGGTIVFLIWIASTFWSKQTGTDNAAGNLGTALASLSPIARYTWLIFRVTAAVITVPIAEELAFRGYLTRRLINRDFDTVLFRRLTYLAIAISSAAFGLMHGQHWVVGIIAGLVYALILKRSGKIGDAIAAHATSNLLLAAWVLIGGHWSFW